MSNDRNARYTGRYQDKGAIRAQLKELRLRVFRKIDKMPKDYMPIAIVPDGRYVCVPKERTENLHGKLAEIIFPEYKVPLAKALNELYIMVAPYKSDSVGLAYIKGEISEKQETAIKGLKEKYSIIDASEERERFNRYNPDAKKEVPKAVEDEEQEL